MNSYQITTPEGAVFTVEACDSDFAVWNANDNAKQLGVASCRATLFLITERGNQELGEFDLDGAEPNPVFEDLADVPNEYQWTGKMAIPSVGQRVRVRCNGLGNGTVTGYQVDQGYLAVMVSVDHLPEYFNPTIEQREHVVLQCFGTEITTPGAAA